MKKILLPTDFSVNSQKAIDYALRLFKNEECIFYLLHAYHDVPSDTGTKMTSQEDLNQLVKTLEAQDDNEKHQFEGILERDSVLNLTNRTQIDKDADYVFMGTKGSSALREFLYGSNTLDLIRYINNCPIVAIPAEYEYNSLHEIVFATDYKHAFKPFELTPLIHLSLLRDATLNIAHIKTEKSFSEIQNLNKELLRKALKGTKHHFFEVEGNESVSNTLYHIEKANKNIGMMAILRTKHGFFERFTREPVVKNITFKTKVPLLVLHQIN